MIAELGQFAIFLALGASLAQAGFLMAGARREDAAWLAAGRHAAVAGAVLVALACAALLASFLANDFTLKAVAERSHPMLPRAYRAAAAWSGPEGEVLLRTAAISLWSLAFRFAATRMALGIPGRALGVLGLVQAGTLATLVATASPFAWRAAGQATGPGLAPALQDPAVFLHLPLLALGTAGLAVVFALAAAALLSGRVDPDWARDCRPWALGAWLFLTAGTALGGFWADGKPGWGGWWPWEPLPTAHLVSWLAATALLHLLPVAEKRRLFVRESAWLALLPFALALLGAWLVRAVPAGSAFPYAFGARQETALLFLFAAAAGGVLALLACRNTPIAGEAAFEMISRESALAASVLVLLGALAAIVLGLLQPLAAEALGLVRGVGESYFNAVFVPLVVPGLALMGPAPRLRWGSQSAAELAREVLRPAIAGLAAVAAAAALLDRLSAGMVTGLFLASWIAWNGLEALLGRARSGPRTANGEPAGPDLVGMHVAHFGVALLVAGVSLSGGLGQSAELAIAPGSAESAGSLRLRAESARETEGPNYHAVRLRVAVLEEGREVVLEPEVRIYATAGLPAARPARYRGLLRDVQIAVAGTAGTGAWVLQVRTQPFMSLVWIGMTMIAGGGLFALARRVVRARSRADDARRTRTADLALGGSG